MHNTFLTALFFPDWINGFPSDFLILHFFFGAIFIPFIMIFRRAKRFDKANPDSVNNGYEEYNKSNFLGYEKIN
tara:strand:+ start:51 stop:272 length:222 start_codon:yes stop_codon:yes gene_type:complete